MAYEQNEGTLRCSRLAVILVLAATLIPRLTQGCGNNLEADSGTFTSPNHPANYDNNLDCTWTITVPVGYTIRLTFSDPFDVEAFGSCSYDYVEIQDMTEKGEKVRRKLCGSSVPDPYHSAGRKLTVKFVSDHGTQHKGFKALFEKQDINECDVGNGGCQHDCDDTDGSYFCSCYYGYLLQEDGASCRDVNECAENTDVCAQNCVNAEGSYTCSCGDGYTLYADSRSCDDINECDVSNGGCQHDCDDTDGSYFCSCYYGYLLQEDGASCRDIDECEIDNGECEHNCTNTEGSYTCSCLPGYTLDATFGVSCTEIDE